MQQLRDGKLALRQARRSAPLDEKLRQLVHAQHLYVQVVGSRRPLKSWQRPWNILNEIRESVVIREDGVEATKPPAVGSSRSQWIRAKAPQKF
jgi:hypothetical protein